MSEKKNEVRFSVCFLYLEPMLDRISIGEIVDEIRRGIMASVDLSLGRGFDGRAIPTPPEVEQFDDPEVLHAEQITFDLS